jgi:hypothetical protein
MRNHRSLFFIFLKGDNIMSDDEDDGDDGGWLRGILGGGNDPEYPPELKSATRAEFTTMVKMNQPDGDNDNDGCKKTVENFIIGFSLISLGILGLLHILPM